MDAATEATLRGQLHDRRRRLESAMGDVGEAQDLVRLLQEVDSALTRMDARVYGRCEVCKENVDEDFLLSNPLIQYCLCNLTPDQQTALQNDLDLAGRIQWALLPKQDMSFAGWNVHFRYEPLGPVSGDYCDLVVEQNDHGSLHVLMGDVSGKGVAASLLMAHLNAMFRSLIQTGLSGPALVERVNRLFAESTIASHYVTVVYVRATASGELEVCNAGHCPPIVLHGSEVTTVGSTGFPVGIRASGPYDVSRVSLAPGDTLVLYTDGLTESFDRGENEYGAKRLMRFLCENAALPPRALAAACLKDAASFRGGVPRSDDLSLMIVRRVG